MDFEACTYYANMHAELASTNNYVVHESYLIIVLALVRRNDNFQRSLLVRVVRRLDPKFLIFNINNA